MLLGGKRIYLGAWGSPESKEEYERQLAEYESQGGKLRPKDTLLCSELAVRYLHHAATYYKRPDGRTTSTIAQVKCALRPIKELYASLPVDKFDIICFKACRQTMIDAGWTRGTVNRTAHFIRELFRWGFEEGLVPTAIPQALALVKKLRLGRTTAPEGRRIPPVDLATVKATKPFMSPVVRDMVEVQLLTGMRPGEVCMVRAVDINMSKDVWIFRPPLHKTSRRGRERLIFIGPKCKA
ncbi:MAG: site-specific integrase, partial [Fibrobacterota bacterium]